MKHTLQRSIILATAILLSGINCLASDSEQLYQAAITRAEKEGTDALSKALNNLANVYAMSDRTADAQKLYKRSLSVLENKYGSSNPALIDTMLALASVYEAQGDQNNAMSLYNRVFAINQKNFGSKDATVGNALSRIAVAKSQQGKLVEAEANFKKSLAILEESLGPTHPDVAKCLNEYAAVLRQLGRNSEAEALASRARTIETAKSQPIKPTSASASAFDTQLIDANKNRTSMDVNEAQTLLSQSERSGAKDYQLTPMFSTLASVYYRQSRYVDAEPLYKRVIEIDEKSLGPDHPGLAADLTNLAMLYKDQKRYDEALPLLGRALSIYQKLYGDANLYRAGKLHSSRRHSQVGAFRQSKDFWRQQFRNGETFEQFRLPLFPTKSAEPSRHILQVGSSKHRRRCGQSRSLICCLSK